VNKISLALFLAACSSTSPSKTPPPSWGTPVSGGTMLVAHDGSHVIVADPDRDRVLSIDLGTNQVAAELPLNPGDEPGRVVEDGGGRFYVALRRGGALLELSDYSTLGVVARVPVCPEPRGLVWDQASNAIDVACTGGELVTVPAGGNAVSRAVFVDRDLRDPVISGGKLYVTRFREAELLALDASGAIVTRVTPPVVARFDESQNGGLGVDGGSGSGSGSGTIPVGEVPAVGAVAWRTLVLPDGRIVMVHQRQLQTVLHTTQGGYGAGCGQGPVETGITVMMDPNSTTGVFASAPAVVGALPVDMAVTAAGDRLAIVTAGSQTVHVVETTALQTPDDQMCGGGDGGGDGSDDGGSDGGDMQDHLGTPTSVQFTPAGDLLVYYPELPAVVVHHGTQAKTITLTGGIGYDSGRALFHTQTSVGLACASCHPEGRDDGLVWQFDTEGTRRTQSLAGDITDRAPYHWAGDEPDLPTLMDDVFATRMAGPQPTNSQHTMLPAFLERVQAPAPSSMLDQAAVARGQVLFQATETACTTCHNGPLFTNHTIVNVGTGGSFKVPSLLGVGARAPYLHDGSAPTLADRFGPQGGGDLHGHTSQLTAAQISDLVAYLQSL
jgi:DNA-binding beta-propeller fold protein YncE/mono/diheme cytochrome c family protein